MTAVAGDGGSRKREAGGNGGKGGGSRGGLRVVGGMK